MICNSISSHHIPTKKKNKKVTRTFAYKYTYVRTRIHTPTQTNKNLEFSCFDFAHNVVQAFNLLLRSISCGDPPHPCRDMQTMVHGDA